MNLPITMRSSLVALFLSVGLLFGQAKKPAKKEKKSKKKSKKKAKAAAPAAPAAQ